MSIAPVGTRTPGRKTTGTRPGVAAALLAVLLATPATAQQAPCGDALLVGEASPWDSAASIAADLTLDGATDAAYWRVDDSRVIVLIGACDGDEVAERWRFAFDLPAHCPPAAAMVETASLYLDPALVDRTCAGESSASECAHLRRENERRRFLMDAGGRALHVGGPSCPVATLRWSEELGGFMDLPQ